MPWTLKVEDQFNDTGGTDLDAHSADLGGAWVQLTGGSLGGILEVDVFGTDVRSVLTGNNAVYSNSQALLDDQAVELESDDAADDTQYLILARLTGATESALDTYALARNHVSDVIQLYRLDNGSFTQLGSNVADTFSAGTLLRLETEGTAIRGLRNGSEVIEETDATYSSGVCGLSSRDNGSRFGTFMKAYELTGFSPGAGAITFSGHVPPMNYTLNMPDEL